MRKWKWLAVAVLLLAGARVEAQCSGYSSNTPSKNVLTPDQVAAQGGTTATIAAWGAYLSGALPSHNLTGTPGMQAAIRWNGNGISASGYYTVDNGTTHYSTGLNFNLSGEDDKNPYWLLASSDVGHTFHLFYIVADANGNTTQDHVNITVVSGPSNTLVSQDSIGTNFYAYMGSSFQGPSMADACTLCQNQPYKCINKMHHPRQHWQVTNTTTGEYHDQGWTYGNVACETCAVSYGGASPFISFNPSDQLSFNVENQVNCDEFGLIYDNNGGDTFSWDTEYAFTTEATIGSMCQLLDEGIAPDGTRHTGIECPVSYFCKKGSAPPDFDPAYLASDRNCAVPNHCTESDIPVFPPYWLMGGFGVRFEIFGVWSPWQFPFYDAAGFVIGLRKKSDFINALFSIGNVALPNPFGANPISCTNSALGTGPITWP